MRRDRGALSIVQRLHVHLDVQRMSPAAQDDAPDRAHIGVVTAPGQRYVVGIDRPVVGRVEVDPFAPDERLDPRVSDAPDLLPLQEDLGLLNTLYDIKADYRILRAELDRGRFTYGVPSFEGAPSPSAPFAIGAGMLA